MKIIIPIAGRGSRFQALANRNPEFKKPKPLISVKGQPMVVWAIKSLPFVDLPFREATTDFLVTPSDLIFICLQEHEEKYQISKLLKSYFTDSISVIVIPNTTRGAVETALFAKDYMTDEELIISDSDHYFQGNYLYEAIRTKSRYVKGIIPVFRPPDTDPKWSFTLTDTSHTALAVKEKDPKLAKKGAYANIGAYYFAQGSLFRQEAEEMIARSEMYGPKGQQEFFVAPVYQKLISKGTKIKVAVIPQVWGLGTPNDLAFFLEHFREG